MDVGEIRAKLTLNMTDFQGKMQSARKEMDHTQQSAHNTAKAFDKIQQASLAFVGVVSTVFATSVGLAANFEQKMKDIQAVSGATGDEMSQLGDLAREMGEKTAFSSAEAAEGIEELVKAGLTVKQVINGGLEGALNLAIAGNLKLADAAEIASTALNAFKADNLSVSQAADILAGAANASATDVSELKYGLSQVSAVAAGAGLSFKDTATALAVFAQNGVKGSDAGTSLKTMLSNLQPQTKAQTELFFDLGLMTRDGANAFYDMNGHLKSMEQIAGILHKSMSGLTDQQRQMTLETIFGSDAVRAGTILYREGADGLNEMWQAMSKVTAADVAAMKMDTLKGAFEELKGSLETAGISLGEEFLPALTQLVRLATGVVHSLDDMDMANVKVALAFGGTASAIVLLGSSVAKLIGYLRILFTSMGPAGWIITGLSLIGGAIAATVVHQNELNEVSLKNAESMLKQADSLGVTIKQFDELKAKSRLTTDEFARFIDINSELSKTADPATIAKLKDEQDKLREKSGLSNEELGKMVQLNGDIVKTVPDATRVISEQGNAIVDNTNKAKAYNKEQYERIRLELEAQKAKAEANMNDYLRKEEETLKRINGLKEKLDGLDTQEIEQRQKVNRLYDDLATAKANNDTYEIDRLNNTIALEENKLEAIKKQRAEAAGLLVEKTEELDKIQQQIGKLDEVNRKMIDLELRQAGLTAKRGEEISVIDTAIGKLQQQKAELEKTTPVNQRNTQEYRDAVTAIQNQITKLQGTKDKILEIIGTAAAMNAVLGKAVYKDIIINEKKYQTYYSGVASGRNSEYHTGGIIGRGQLPMLHVGGLASQFAKLPSHNEVDVRLLRNEMVLTEAQQANLMRMIDAGMTSGNANLFTASEIDAIKSLLDTIARNTAQAPSVVVDGNSMFDYINTKQSDEFRRELRNGGYKR